MPIKNIKLFKKNTNKKIDSELTKNDSKSVFDKTDRISTVSYWREKLDAKVKTYAPNKFEELTKDIKLDNSTINRNARKIKRIIIINKFSKFFGIIFFILGITAAVFGYVFISNKYDMGKNTIMYGSILFAACLILIIGDIYIVVSAKLRNKKLAKLISKNGELLKEVYAVINTDTYLNMFSELYSGTSFDKYLDCNWENLIGNSVTLDGSTTVIGLYSGHMHTNPFIIITTRAIIDNSTSMFGKTNPSPFSYNQNTSPSYVDRSFLIYFSSAVKELNFSNKKQGIFEKNKNKQYDMDNPEFDKLFPTTRDNETSFRTLFTPLAQEEILNLIKSIGKYDFNKDGMCSTINCKEIKGKDIVVSNKYFNEYSMERIKNNFNKKFYDFFKNIYFLFAPIICIPLFSQYEFKDKLTNDKKSICGNVAAHVILNSEMNPMSLSHRQGKTKVIFEVKTISSDDDHQVDQVIAKNYKTVTTRRRVGNSTQTTTTYVPVRKQWSMKHFLTNDKTNYSELIKTIKNEYPKNKGIIKTINKVSVIY